MNMLEVHAGALDSGIVPYHEFLYPYKNKCIVYGFVEGNDDPIFYRGLIEQHLPNEWDLELIRSGNKDRVLEVMKNMDWSRFSRKRICFFVDRDLSEFVDEKYPLSENLYITDKYSIENEVVTFRTMKRVLEEVFNVTKLNSTETDVIKMLFDFNLTSFQETMTPIMSQILIWRRSGEKVCLNNILPKELFRFVEGKIELISEFAVYTSRIEYAAECANAPLATIDELRKAESEFRAHEGVNKYIRGKYLLWFFMECTLAIYRDIRKFCKGHPSSPKSKLPLGVANIMTIAGNRVRCPDSLKIFIEHNYCEYIKETNLIL